MTVMNRLTANGYLRRTKGPAKSFIYRPTEGREAFATRCCQQNIDDLVNRYGDTALVQCKCYAAKVPIHKSKKITSHHHA